MEALWYGIVFGLVIGVVFTLIGIFGNYKVERREWWEEYEREAEAARSGLTTSFTNDVQERLSQPAGLTQSQAQ